MLVNIIVFLVITAMVAGAMMKIIKDKKNGIKCSGCPHSGTCPSSQACSGSLPLESLDKATAPENHNPC